jgi:hypothetical protein
MGRVDPKGSKIIFQNGRYYNAFFTQHNADYVARRITEGLECWGTQIPFRPR